MEGQSILTLITNVYCALFAPNNLTNKSHFPKTSNQLFKNALPSLFHQSTRLWHHSTLLAKWFSHIWVTTLRGEIVWNINLITIIADTNVEMGLWGLGGRSFFSGVLLALDVIDTAPSYVFIASIACTGLIYRVPCAFFAVVLFSWLWLYDYLR